MIAFFGLLMLPFVISAKQVWDTPRCKAGDNVCLPGVISYYLKNAANGIPAMSLIPIDPLFVPEINIIQGSDSPVNIKLFFKNVTFTGFSKLKVSKTVGFEKDPKSSHFEIFGMIPQLQLIGHYSVSGNVLVLPVVGNGPANLTFENVDASVKLHPKVELKKNKEYAHMNKVRVDFNTTRLYMNFENLYNGDKLLGDSTNKFLNENWQEILNELKPVLKDVISGIAHNIIKPVFEKFPYEHLYLE